MIRRWGRRPRARARAGIGLALALAALAGCGRSPTRVRTDLPPADQMTLGARDVQNGDYYEALSLLKGYIEREPAGERADEAHYLMGVCYFRTKEWPSAATEFAIVINQFADSPHLADAHYFLGLSYWKEARGAPYDQDYTERAITEFDTFLGRFPAHPRAAEIRDLRRQAEARLAHKDYENGRLYLRMNFPGPARFYFQEVQRKYPDSVWAAEAALGEARSYAKEDKWAEAAAVLDRLLADTPPPQVAADARKLVDEARRRAGAPAGK